MLIIGEWSICTLAAHWVGTHIEHLTVSQFFVVTFGAAAIARYALRTGLLHNLQGVREGTAEKPVSSDSPQSRNAA